MLKAYGFLLFIVNHKINWQMCMLDVLNACFVQIPIVSELLLMKQDPDNCELPLSVRYARMFNLVEVCKLYHDDRQCNLDAN